MSRLNQINHWNKPTQNKKRKKKIKQKIFLTFLKFILLLQPMHHSSVMPFRARKKHGWMAQKMCSKESAYSREALEEIKNHYIKEEDA